MAKVAKGVDESKFDPAAIKAALLKAKEDKTFLKPKKSERLEEFKDIISDLMKDGAAAPAITSIIHGTGYLIPESTVRTFMSGIKKEQEASKTASGKTPAPAPAPKK